MTELNRITKDSMKRIIEESHRRCESYGLSRETVPTLDTFLTEEELINKKSKYGEFIRITDMFGKKVIERLAEKGVVILIADKENVILEHFGDEKLQEKLIAINMVSGAKFDERVGGTSSNFLATKYNCSIEVVGEDHFHKPLHGMACYSVPFSFEECDIGGTVTIMTSIEGHTNYRMALLESLVDSVLKEYRLKRNYKRELLINSVIKGNSNIGIILIDRLGSITDYNSKAEKIIGKKSSSLMGQHFDLLGFMGDEIRECYTSQKTISNIDIIFEQPDGKVVRALVDANPIIEEGYVRGVYIQLKDVTEKYELEQHVIISDRFSAIGKLAAGLAHEIRNPLTSVMGFMQILKNSGDYSKAESYMPIMYGELQRVKQLVSDFVLASKPSAPLTSETNLHHLLDETVMFMESQALLKGVELSKEYNIPQNVMLHIDAAQIKQVLINTIQNAIEATESSGGHVTLGCHVNAKKNMCVISIEDTGVGMDEEELNQITTPFFTTKETGTGLGMAVTYRIIENHGGKIRINSKKGVGTRVDIILPY